MSGRLIAFEGGEGAGKSTQAALLAEWLRTQGREVVETREPGGTPAGDAIRALLLSRDVPLTPLAEAYLFAAARAEHVERVIRPALEAGNWVVCDRFVASSLAYQGAAGGLGVELVEQINAAALDGLRPDLTVYLRTGPATGAARAAERDGDSGDRFGERGEAFHIAVAEAFDRLSGEDPERFAVIDASGDIETVAAAVREAVGKRLG